MKVTLNLVLALFISTVGWTQGILTDKSSFSITKAMIYVDPGETELVKTAAQHLQQDIEQVTGAKLPILTAISQIRTNVIAIGTIQQSSFLKQLISQKKINTNAIRGKWEASLVQTIGDPAPGISQALIIAGNDRRGVAYGVFELSKQIGVSLWNWWADVPVVKRKEIYIKRNVLIVDAPKVKYRGLFINDEAPALSGWTKEKFGGFNHKFYEKFFELVLRSVDDEMPQIISLNKEDKTSDKGIWNKRVAENIIVKPTTHTIVGAGKHTVKFWMVNPGVVLQKLVIDFGKPEPSYLGPQETVGKTTNE